MSYKNYHWEKVASDYDSFLFRNYIFTKSFYLYQKFYGISRVVIGVLAEKNKIIYTADMKTWNICHQELKTLVEKDYKFVGNIIDKTISQGKKFNQWSEQKIYNRDVSTLSENEIIDLYEEFISRQAEMYAIGTALPILDFHDYKFIESNLEKILKKRAKGNDYSKNYQLFTQPVANSFAMEQEENLLKIIKEYFNNKDWLKVVLSKNFDSIQKKYPEFADKLIRHTKEYGWVYYVYSGPAYNEHDFINFIRDYIKKGIHPIEILKINKNKHEQREAEKEIYIKKNRLNNFEKEILTVAGKIVWGKPRRKDYQSKSYYYFEKLQREIGRRLYLSLVQVRSLPLDILYKALKKGIINPDISNKIYNQHACLPNDNGSISLLVGAKADDFKNKYIKIKSTESLLDINEIKGECACRGKAEGVVKIINQVADMAKMDYGDVLVATATAPAIVSAMKKASAIITDEGGLTCHASIVSRELNIPCVIGTKIATQVLSDGDQVEVDAGKGIVKKIK